MMLKVSSHRDISPERRLVSVGRVYQRCCVTKYIYPRTVLKYKSEVIYWSISILSDFWTIQMLMYHLWINLLSLYKLVTMEKNESPSLKTAVFAPQVNSVDKIFCHNLCFDLLENMSTINLEQTSIFSSLWGTLTFRACTFTVLLLT